MLTMHLCYSKAFLTYRFLQATDLKALKLFTILYAELEAL